MCKESVLHDTLTVNVRGLLHTAMLIACYQPYLFDHSQCLMGNTCAILKAETAQNEENEGVMLGMF
jgi:hypothetical protein